jgi:hypothetical protein
VTLLLTLFGLWYRSFASSTSRGPAISQKNQNTRFYSSTESVLSSVTNWVSILESCDTKISQRPTSFVSTTTHFVLIRETTETQLSDVMQAVRNTLKLLNSVDIFLVCKVYWRRYKNSSQVMFEMRTCKRTVFCNEVFFSMLRWKFAKFWHITGFVLKFYVFIVIIKLVFCFSWDDTREYACSSFQDEILWIRQWTFGLYKRQGISLLPDNINIYLYIYIYIIDL